MKRPFQSLLLFSRQAVMRLKHVYLGLCLSLAMPVLIHAAITAPVIEGVTGNNPLGAGKAVGKSLGELFIYFLFIIGFVAAAWAAIDGLFKGLRKGEWGQFGIALGAAIVMLVFVGWALSQGELALANLA